MAPRRDNNRKDDKPQGTRPQDRDKSRNDRSRAASNAPQRDPDRSVGASPAAGGTTARDAYFRYFSRNPVPAPGGSNSNPSKVTKPAKTQTKPKPKPNDPHWKHFIEDFEAQWPIFLAHNKWNKRMATGEPIDDTNIGAITGANAGANDEVNLENAKEEIDPRMAIRHTGTPASSAPSSPQRGLEDRAADLEPTNSDPYATFFWNPMSSTTKPRRAAVAVYTGDAPTEDSSRAELAAAAELPVKREDVNYLDHMLRLMDVADIEKVKKAVAKLIKIFITELIKKHLEAKLGNPIGYHGEVAAAVRALDPCLSTLKDLEWTKLCQWDTNCTKIVDLSAETNRPAGSYEVENLKNQVEKFHSNLTASDNLKPSNIRDHVQRDRLPYDEKQALEDIQKLLIATEERYSEYQKSKKEHFPKLTDFLFKLRNHTKFGPMLSSTDGKFEKFVKLPAWFSEIDREIDFVLKQLRALSNWNLSRFMRMTDPVDESSFCSLAEERENAYYLAHVLHHTVWNAVLHAYFRSVLSRLRNAYMVTFVEFDSNSMKWWDEMRELHLIMLNAFGIDHGDELLTCFPDSEDLSNNRWGLLFEDDIILDLPNAADADMFTSTNQPQSTSSGPRVPEVQEEAGDEEMEDT
ncbi:hypothetical protein H2200_012526 [Cladophialophora chaetospira]|uniref:Uncharacterized protein n=1 Tax=Cladophialophora chaetospira TaxID=386627 RepID=A0AA39CCI9_9EURO|nr:hypothetical protein H2200_012526 [Cladophialophora chaetospira]